MLERFLQEKMIQVSETSSVTAFLQDRATNPQRRWNHSEIYVDITSKEESKLLQLCTVPPFVPEQLLMFKVFFLHVLIQDWEKLLSSFWSLNYHTDFS